MTWMNEMEIEDARVRYAGHPVKRQATRILQELVELANSCSDGWPYWKKPSRAAKKLMELVQRDDPTAAELRKACVPIKSFLTRYAEAVKRSGLTVNFGDVLPKRYGDEKRRQAARRLLEHLEAGAVTTMPGPLYPCAHAVGMPRADFCAAVEYLRGCLSLVELGAGA